MHSYNLPKLIGGHVTRLSDLIAANGLDQILSSSALLLNLPSDKSQVRIQVFADVPTKDITRASKARHDARLALAYNLQVHTSLLPAVDEGNMHPNHE